MATSTVTMFAPDGSTGEIPQDKVQAAQQAGFKQAITMTSPDGKKGYIPQDRVSDAMKAGFLQPGVKIVGKNSAGQPIYAPEGDTSTPEQSFGHVLSSAGDVVVNAAKGLIPQSWGDLAKRSIPGYSQYNMVVKPLIEQGQQAVQAAQSGHPALAAGHGLAAMLPVVGPQAAHLGEQLGTQIGTGDYTGAGGTVLGNAALIAAPVAATRLAGAAAPLVSNIADRTAVGLYRNAMKPPPGSMTAAESTAKVRTGLDYSIPVSASGVEKLGDLVDDFNNKIAAELQSAPNRTIDPNAVATRINQTKGNFANQVNAQGDLNAIEASRQQFLDEQGRQPGTPAVPPQPTGLLDAQGRPIMTQGTPATPPTPAPPMSAVDAQSMKQGTYGILRKKYGEQGSAAVEAQKSLARGLKEEIATQFPEISNLNAAESRLLDLGPTLERAVNRISNNHTIGIGGPIMSGGIKAATGSSGLAGTLGVMKSIFDIPAVKSQVAIALSKGARIPYPQALARVSAYQAALGSSALGSQAYSSDDNSTQAAQ